jgi:hypothetical protein
MENIISFRNSRLIEWHRNLCYNDTILFFLYSLLDFRNRLYHLTELNIPKVEEVDPMELLFKFKKIFILMDRRITENNYEKKYIINDNRILIGNNDFYKELYKPVFLDILKTFGELKYKQDFNWFNIGDPGELDNSLIRTLNVFNVISNELFCHNRMTNGSINYIYTESNTHEITEDRNYIIILPERSETTKTDRIKTKFDININSVNYKLISIMLGWKGTIKNNGNIYDNKTGEPEGHFWLYNINDNVDINKKYNNIDDLNDSFIENVDRRSISSGYNRDDDIFFSIYIKEDEYNRKQNINDFSPDFRIKELSKSSSNINNSTSNQINDLNHFIFKKLLISELI